jgi:hypothetical protein
MHFDNAHSTIRSYFVIGMALILMPLFLSACGGGGGGSNTSDNSSTLEKVSNSIPAPSTNTVGLVADGKIIGLVPDTTSGERAYVARANNQITLTGKDSVEANSAILSYEWVQTSGAPVNLNKRGADTAVFNTPNLSEINQLSFQLTITDADQNKDSDSVSLTVIPVDDGDQFLTDPDAPPSVLRIRAALRGGDATGLVDQNFSIEFVTIAHWRNRLGVADQIVIKNETVDSLFPKNFNPTVDYDALSESKNPTIINPIYSLDADDINVNFETENRDRRLDTSQISSAFIEVQINVTNPSTVDFELLAVDSNGQLINGNNILSPSTLGSLVDLSKSNGDSAKPINARLPTAATNGALLQTWNAEFTASVLSDKVLTALGLESNASSSNYYLLIDPTANFASLKNWLNYAGFDENHAAASNDPNIGNAVYFNNYDLGYGRNTWLRKDDSGDVFSYVTNFPSVEATLACQNDFSVFAMEYSDNPDTSGLNEKIVKFYAYIPDASTGEYVRVNSINIDGQGEKQVPGVCTGCHQSYTGSRQFTDVSEADLNAAFIPLDVDSFLYAKAQDTQLIEPSFNATKFKADYINTYSRETLEDEFREINLGVLATYADDPSRHAAAIELVHGWYGDEELTLETNQLPNENFNSGYVQPGWSGQEDLYNDVYVRNCRTCHTQVDDEALNFDDYDEFVSNEKLTSHVYQQGLMPSSRITMDRFWVDFYGGVKSADILRDHLEGLGGTVPVSPPGAPVPEFGFTSAILPDEQEIIVLDASESSFVSSYLWSLSVPADSSASLNNTTGLTSSFSPDIPRENFDVTLTVTGNDGAEASITQTVTARSWYLPLNIY